MLVGYVFGGDVTVHREKQDAIDFLVYVLSGKPKITIITIEHHHF